MIFRPSGGLVYHFRAWQQRARWAPFTSAVADWLSAWNPPCRELVLLGPSGGYTLTTEWLCRFAVIEAYDLDPLAPYFFKRRHAGLNPVHFHRQNLFWQNGLLSLEPLRQVLQNHPTAAILFSNVLGQVLLEGSANESEWKAYLVQLRRGLRHRHWASYHDLFSDHGSERTDHLMQGEWSQNLAKTQWTWPLTRHSVHSIEGIVHSPEP